MAFFPNFEKIPMLNIFFKDYITPLKAVILFKMLLLCSLGIQLANYIRNLNLDGLMPSFCSSNFHFDFFLSLLQ